MASFNIDPPFEAKLEWIRQFVRAGIEPLDVAFGGEEVLYDKSHPVHDAVIRPLQDRVVVPVQYFYICYFADIEWPVERAVDAPDLEPADLAGQVVVPVGVDE